MITYSEPCRYGFTRDELVEIAREQARLMGEMTAETENFDQLKADHKSKVMTLEASISNCTRRVSSGYEMRSTKCMLLKFRPDLESAMVVRMDNGRVLRKRKLDDNEKQLTLTTNEPPSYTHEADFYEDTDSDTAMMVAELVPLLAAEAEALKDVVEIRPLRKLL